MQCQLAWVYVHRWTTPFPSFLVPHPPGNTHALDPLLTWHACRAYLSHIAIHVAILSHELGGIKYRPRALFALVFENWHCKVISHLVHGSACQWWIRVLRPWGQALNHNGQFLLGLCQQQHIAKRAIPSSSTKASMFSDLLATPASESGCQWSTTWGVLLPILLTCPLHVLT